MFRVTIVPVLVSLVALPTLQAQDKEFDKAVTKVEASFSPAEAKPGQTVTWKLTVSLAPGFHTYPLVQTDKKAASMVNKLTFPDAGDVVFVGEAMDPANPQSKAEPLLGIQAMKYYSDKVVYERKVVVSPSAKAGKVTVKLPKFVLSVCDDDNCFPPKTLSPTATLTVLDGPAVAVEAKYAAEVQKATEKK